MRMRKKPWANDMIESRGDCVIANPVEYKGKWKQFGFERIVVEIGAGKGDYWIGMAHNNPDELWIAVERESSCAAIALKKCLDCTTANMKFIIADAAEIATWFDENEVDRIHLNFSDPWPKKRNAKRRLTYGSFLNDYRRILKPEGQLIMKTDNSKLFEFSLVSFSENHWPLKEAYVNFRETVHDEDTITEYEHNFMEKGQPIYRAIWQSDKAYEKD